ncbi:MAG: DUF3179 domain-containing protein [Ornithinimicrobium sp.]
MTRSALALASLSAVLVLAGCAGNGESNDGSASRDGSASSPAGASEDGREGVGEASPPGSMADSALADMRDADFPEPLIDPDQVRSGGPPPDGIPPIDEPSFETASQVDWLTAEEPVLSLTVGEDTRAYPLRVMTWHEIVNDTVGGKPLAVTYCPLCNSGVAFEREVGGEVTTFGTSGRLYQDNLVMYDRQSESLWPQLTGQASIGVRTGEQLTAIPIGTVPWSDFAAANPEAMVLSQDTGFDRPYGQNPYVGYDQSDGDVLFDLGSDLDSRLLIKERVIGVSGASSNVAYVRAALVGEDPVEVDLGGQAVVLWHLPGQNSALDTAEISEGNDVGTVGVFTPEADGRALTFERRGDAFVDLETQSTWDVLGNAVEGPLEGESLAPVTHLDTFWFSWVLFHPDTTVQGS